MITDDPRAPYDLVLTGAHISSRPLKIAAAILR
jgi:hypothetical protein